MMTKPKVELSSFVKKIFETPVDQSFKFGYYNLQPLSADGKRLLAHKIPFEGRLPAPNEKVEIGYFSLSDGGAWVKVSESSAFNWQQGSMLQWLGPDFKKKIVFNDADRQNIRYISKIIDLDEGSERILPHAVYAIHPSGQYSISLNFERSSFTRAYGYTSVEDKSWNAPCPDKDGILRVDIRSGKVETIIKLSDVVRHNYLPHFQGRWHWLEHIMMNPRGDRFAFYHRFTSDNDFVTRVFTADCSGDQIWMHPNKDSERLTHLGWQNEEKYVLFTIPQSRLRSAWAGKPGRTRSSWFIKTYRNLVKPFIPRKIVTSIPNPSSYYALTTDRQGAMKQIRVQPSNMDGHPSFTRCGRYMLSDTYADSAGFRSLILHDLNSNKTFVLGRFFSVYNKCAWRSDLHPRFSPDEGTIMIDSNHSGHTQIIMLKLDWDKLGLR